MRRALALALALAALAQAQEPAPLASLGELNSQVLAVVQSYPLDGTHRFHWPKGGGWEGTTRTLTWGGQKLTSGDPQGRCYCCGLTYEVFVRTLERALGRAEHPALTHETMHEARLRFFGDSKQGERRKLVAFALPSLGLGREITRREDARAGDFVQLWRHDGSGHQAVFVNWQWRKGKIAGLTYWSTQGGTRGIGYNTEWIGPDGVKEDEIYLARLAPGAR